MEFIKSKGYDPLRARLLYDDEGNSRGFGFVEFDTDEKAKEAIEKLNNVMF